MNDDVVRYWSFARQNLRLTDAEFWRLTPREFRALADAWDDGEQAKDRRAATVCMVIANVNRDADKKPEPFQISDFMPSRGPAAPVKEQSWEMQKGLFLGLIEAAKQTKN